MVSLQMQEMNSNDYYITHSFVNALICVQCSEHLSLIYYELFTNFVILSDMVVHE